MERSGYSYSYKDNVSGFPPNVGERSGERVITETEKERGYSVKCCGCIPLCFDKTDGPLIRGDTSVFARPSGFLRLLQLIPLIIAFIAVELANWCFFGLRSYRFFSTVTMTLIWINLIFFFIYLCQCQWRMRCFDCYILDFLYHAIAITLLIVSSIFLALNVCSTGHIVGAVFGFIAALLYMLSAFFLAREYMQFRKMREQERAWKNYNRSTMSSTIRDGQQGSPNRFYPTPPPNMSRDPRGIYDPSHQNPNFAPQSSPTSVYNPASNPDYYRGDYSSRQLPPNTYYPPSINSPTNFNPNINNQPNIGLRDAPRQVPIQLEEPLDYYTTKRPSF
ncbi:unnamed protein product [Gordionus sp. m RMFG-2023]|uniref:uncharacterized protein LOC135923548 n=1 Tax=Gordionus sp. m RMFG-2023 TaxID=3053472 RepID=UPI0030E4C889